MSWSLTFQVKQIYFDPSAKSDTTPKEVTNSHFDFDFSFSHNNTKFYQILELSDLEACLISHIFVLIFRIFFGWLMSDRNHHITPAPAFNQF